MLSIEAIVKYQKLVKKHSGVDIDIETARKQATQLKNLIKIVFEDENIMNSYLFYKSKRQL